MYQMYHQPQQQHGMPPQQPGFNGNTSVPQAQPAQPALPLNRMPPPIPHDRMTFLLAQLKQASAAHSNNQYGPMMNSSGPAQGIDAANTALASATALAQAATAAVHRMPMARAPSGGYTQHGHSHSQNGFGPPNANGSSSHSYGPAPGQYKPGVPSALRSFLVATAPNAPSLNNVHHMASYQPSGRPAPARAARGRGRGAGGTRSLAVTSAATIRKRKPHWDGSDDSDGAAIVTTASTLEDNTPAVAAQAPAGGGSTNTTAAGRRKAKGAAGTALFSAVEAGAVAVKQEEAVAVPVPSPPTSAAAVPSQLAKAASVKLARAARNKAVVVPIQVHQEFEEDADIMLGCDRCQYAPVGVT